MASDTFWARLVHGNKKLEIDADPYILAKSFSPPAVNRSVNYANGSGKSPMGGKRISENYADRAWSFNVCIYGANEAEVLGYVSRLAAFLENARDTQYPLWLEYYPYDAVNTIPLWGQGVYRYTIKDATCQIISPWDVRDDFAVVSVNCRIAPTIEGQRQRVAYAEGGIYEDTIKTPDGQSRGVQVCTAGTNLMTNPIFSHATWNTGWTMSSDGLTTKITDGNKVLFGEACALIQNIGNAGTARAYYQQDIVTTGTADYIISAYVRLLDGREPGTTDVQLRGTASLGEFNSIECGDGWYRIWDIASSLSGTVNIGITLTQPGVACYVDGFQMEVHADALEDPSPLMHGDAVGCKWSSTRGASTSVRTAGFITLPVSGETINKSSGAIRMAVKWNMGSGVDHKGYIFYAGTAFNSYYQIDSGQGSVVFSCGGKTVTDTSLDATQGEIEVYHFSWGKTESGTAEIKLAYNGQISTNGTVLIGDWTYDNVYIGGGPSGGTAKLNATILDFAVFDHNLSYAEITNSYEQVSEHLTGGDGLGQSLSRLPYLWTRAGDGTVQSYPSTTTADYAIAHGIPGNMPARTIIDMKATFAGTADGGFMVANQVYKDVLDELNMYSATDVAQNVATTAVTYPSGGTTIALTRQLDAYRGKQAYFLTSLLDAGSTYCKGRMVIGYDTVTNAYYSDFTSLATDGTAAWYLVGPMIIPDTLPSEFDWLHGYGELNAYMQLLRTSGAGTITMSELRFIPGDFVYAPISGLTTNHALIIDGDRGYSYNSSTSKEDGIITLYGDSIELVPGKYNHLITIPMKIGRDTNTADTVTINRVYVTPRYSLL